MAGNFQSQRLAASELAEFQDDVSSTYHDFSTTAQWSDGTSSFNPFGPFEYWGGWTYTDTYFDWDSPGPLLDEIPFTNFVVGRTRVFDQSGDYTATSEVLDNRLGTTESDTSTVSVGDAPFEIVAARTTLLADVGASTTGVPLATVVDVQPYAGGGTTLTAEVDWGDGQMTSATLNPLSSGTYEVVGGSHAYAHEGSYTITVLVSRDGQYTAATTLTAQVTDRSWSVAGANIAAFANAASGPVTVATISDPAGGVSAFTASIDWFNDGTLVAAQVQATTNPLVFNVVASLPFGPGAYKFTVYVTDPVSGITLLAQSTANVYSLMAQSGGGLVGDVAATGAVRADDPDRALALPLGNETVSLNTGALSVSYPLDFDMSPGTSVGGDPELVYNSSTATARPVIELTIQNLLEAPALTQVSVQLTWNGVVQGTFGFAVAAGVGLQPSFDVAVQPAAVSVSGIYSWSATVRLQSANGLYAVGTTNGTAAVVAQNNPNRPVPLGAGWGIAGIDQIAPEFPLPTTGSGDGGGSMSSCDDDSGSGSGSGNNGDLPSSTSLPFLMIYGDGTLRIFSPTGDVDQNGNPIYANPEDFGTLVRKPDGTFQYTATDGTVTVFDATGRQTSVTDRDGQTITYGYNSSGQLTTVSTPDGGVTTFSWGGSVTINEPGRTVTLAGGSTLTSITVTPAGATAAVNRSFSYNSLGQMTSDIWAPMSATIVYNTTGQVTSVNLGSGSVYTIVSAAALALAPTVQVVTPGTATVTDALGNTTTYTVDMRGRELSEVQDLDDSVAWEAPQTITQTWQLNSAGDVVQYTDGLNRVTTYRYSGRATTKEKKDGGRWPRGKLGDSSFGALWKPAFSPVFLLSQMPQLAPRGKSVRGRWLEKQGRARKMAFATCM